MKKTLLITVLSLTLLTTYSQSFKGGIILGLEGSQIDGDNQSFYKKAGVIIGAYVERPFSDKASLKIESYYVGKGAVKNVKYGNTTIQEANTSLHYIEMPFLYRYKLLPKFDIELGIAPSYLFAHKLKTYGYEINKNYYTMIGFDIQPIAKAGFYLTENIITYLHVSYSIFSIRKNRGWYNNNVGISIAYSIK